MRFARAILVLVMLTLPGCQQAPRPLQAGVDACEFCRMTVSDLRFGGEIQSGTGRLHTFDSIECLASYYVDAESRGDVKAAWVSDFESHRLVPVDSAIFLQDGRVNSPMGRNLAAFAPGARDVEQRFGGRLTRWQDILASLRERGLERGAQVPDTAAGSGSR